MLVELVLDLQVVLQRHRRVSTQFVLFVPTNFMKEMLLNQLKTTLRSLMPEAFPESLGWLDVVRVDRARDPKFRGSSERWRSWSTYCDFSVKQEDVDGPNLWPFERVRSFKCVAAGWEARDRDGRKLAVLTSQGKTELMDAATCPITVEQEGQSLVSYPPLVIPDQSILLRAPFVL